MATPGAPVGLPPLPPNIGSIVGSQLIGVMLNFALFGVLAVQAYVYHITFPHDNLEIKGLVYFVVAFETAQTIMTGVDAFRWFATGFGNILEVAKPGLGPVNTPIMGAIMALVVQTFFCYRIWVLKKAAWPLSLFIVAIAIISAVSGFIGGVQAMVIQNVADDHDTPIVVNLWLICDVVADVLIAAAMTFLLLRATDKKHRQTNTMVTKIIQLTVETNVASSILAILTLALYSHYPSTTYFICPSMLLGKTYANSLLLSFNNRAYVLKERETTMHDSGYTSQSTRFSSGMALSNADTYTLGSIKPKPSTSYGGVEPSSAV